MNSRAHWGPEEWKNPEAADFNFRDVRDTLRAAHRSAWVPSDVDIPTRQALGHHQAFVLINLGSASVAILGTALSLLAGAVAQEAVTASLVPLTAGGFVYLAAADLNPELPHDRSLAL